MLTFEELSHGDCRWPMAEFDAWGLAKTQAHRGICWAFARRQLHPQGIGKIRLDALPLELREP